jgi:methionine-rich copper-binding protein CopC
MKKLLLVLLSITALAGNVAFAAHAKLVQSTPADGTVTAATPATFILEFTEAVTLHEVYIKKDDDKATPLRNLPHNDTRMISIPMSMLAAGHYVLEWSVFTHDSIVLNGRIRFTVSGDSAAAASTSQ